MSKIVEVFECQVKILKQSLVHSHKSSTEDENLIGKDLRGLPPFRMEDGRIFETFPHISHNPTHCFNKGKFKEWTERHQNNILLHYYDDSEELDE